MICHSHSSVFEAKWEQMKAKAAEAEREVKEACDLMISD